MAFENTKRKRTSYAHYAHTGATHFSFKNSNNARVSTAVSRIRCAHGLRVHIYCQKHVVTIETMSEFNKAYSCIVTSAARDGDMLSE